MFINGLSFGKFFFMIKQKGEKAMRVAVTYDNGNVFGHFGKTEQFKVYDIEEGKVSIEESGGHIGLINTCLRLHYYSQGKMRVAIRNDNGAVITLFMPYGKKENPD